MEFCFYQENHVWYLAIKDSKGNILGKSAFEDFFTVANVLEIAPQLGKAVDFKVNVNFTNQVKG
ncbi:MAG: hypothetical protein IKO49_03615 [Bacilli bacterium]|nr:hypothetical protein [Clostridia bacterium]MBR4618373.1 hypothetical protein [Bacilli bacterium]